MDEKISLKNRNTESSKLDLDYLIEFADKIVFEDLPALDELPDFLHIYCRKSEYTDKLRVLGDLVNERLLENYSNRDIYFGPRLEINNKPPMEKDYSILVDDFFDKRSFIVPRPKCPRNAREGLNIYSEVKNGK